MKASIALILSFVVSSAAVPAGANLNERAFTPTDDDIFNYALTLEHLLDKFYREGLANYSNADFIKAGFPDPFHANLKDISADETEHVKFLTGALKTAGATPVSECTYSFPSTDPKSFVVLASLLQGVGVSAFLGSVADIIDSGYQTTAVSMLSIEARYSAYLRAILSGRPSPTPFDAPLDPDEVETLVSSFIISCPPPSPKLPFKSFPKLELGTPGNIFTGGTITLKTPGYTLKPKNGTEVLHAAFITVTGPIFENAIPVDGGFSVKVPGGIAGQNYMVLTSYSNETVTDDTIVAGPVVVEIKN